MPAVKKAKTATKAKAKTKVKAKTTKKTAAKKSAAKKVVAKKAKTKTAPKKTAAKKKAAPKKKAVKSAKPHVTKKTTAKAKTKIKPTKPTSDLADDEKEHLLLLIGEIIHLHKTDPDGLKSLEAIERILDRYNQRYTQPTDKFDAIVKYGMSKDPKSHVHVRVDGLQPDTVHLYELLSAIGHGKVKYPEAKEKMLDVFEETPGKQSFRK